MSVPASVIDLAPGRWVAFRRSRTVVTAARTQDRWVLVDGLVVHPHLCDEDVEARPALVTRADFAEYMAARPWSVFIELLDALGVAHRFRVAEAIPYTIVLDAEVTR